MQWEKEWWALLANPVQLQSEEHLITDWTCINVWLNCPVYAKVSLIFVVFYYWKRCIHGKVAMWKDGSNVIVWTGKLFLWLPIPGFWSLYKTFVNLILFWWSGGFVFLPASVQLALFSKGRSPLFILRKSISLPSSLSAHTASLLSRLSNFSSANNFHIAHIYAINLH